MNILNKISSLLVKTTKIIKSSINNKAAPTIVPVIVSRSEHNISRANISSHVLKILYTLKDAGYQSYLVGGGVRDLLLNIKPKDFDVATDAYPEKIKNLFKRCYIVGRRFPLAHVHFGNNVVEVATFRAAHRSKPSKEGMILRDNVYGNIAQDALRRDFTVNALYYNIADYTVIDYVDGIKDLQAKQLRLIGDPVTRYREDPVRMLRAIRFAAKLGFTIHANTAQPIHQLGSLLLNISPARLYEEYIKLFLFGHAKNSFMLLQQYGLANILFPYLKNQTKKSTATQRETNSFITHGLNYIDIKVNQNQEINPAFLIAILLWHQLHELAAKHISQEKISEFLAYKQISERLLSEQNKIISLSKKLTSFIKDIWLLQTKLAKIAGKPGKAANKLHDSIKFNMAFEFLQLRAASGEKKAQKIFRWWSKYISTQKPNIPTLQA